jgi:NAD(P)-dependent dehydrogenase (short-subunit alcohol dehydrogenase family)
MYSQSKLANLLFALELDRRLKAAGSHIESLGSHPGYSATDLQRHSMAWRLLNPLFGIAPVRGAAPTLYAATESDALIHRYWGPVGSLEARGWTGKAKITDRAADEDVARRLWEMTEKVTGIQFEI